MPVIIIHTPPPYRPHFVPQSRLNELIALQKKRPLRVSDFRLVNEFERFHYPDGWERLFYEWGDPKEVGKHLGDKVLSKVEPMLMALVKESQSFGTVVQK